MMGSLIIVCSISVFLILPSMMVVYYENNLTFIGDFFRNRVDNIRQYVKMKSSNSETPQTKEKE